MTLRRNKTVITVISKIGDRRTRSEACLVVIYGDDLGRRYPLQNGENVVGRSHKASIQIDHESVSRRHACLDVSQGGVVLTDMQSTNGTYVNDGLVKERTLADGDLLKVGRTIFKYLAGNNIEQAYHEEIYRLTTVDGLTHCFNRRYFAEQTRREVSRATRYGRPLALVVFEVQGFQALNHEYGHLAGDAVLAQLADRVRQKIRQEDIFARLEGGLFAIVLPETTLEQAAVFAAKVSHVVRGAPFEFDGVQMAVQVETGRSTLDDGTLEVPSGRMLRHDEDTLEMSAADSQPGTQPVFESVTESLLASALGRLDRKLEAVG